MRVHAFASHRWISNGEQHDEVMQPNVRRDRRRNALSNRSSAAKLIALAELARRYRASARIRSSSNENRFVPVYPPRQDTGLFYCRLCGRRKRDCSMESETD
ncbi:hypothetical protein PUN28_019887 [Cardiocondyla obscurior]|uniref:Uncharacterized protein n=1 Tax=Cardiocondyla obscurior TaxID=286306 RepID=A0AAW2EAQ5_9HYME